MELKEKIRKLLILGGLGAMGLAGLSKCSDAVEEHNERAEMLNRQLADESAINDNGMNTEVAKFAEHGAISGLYGRPTNIDTGRETGDMLDKRAPEEGALAGICDTGQMLGNTLIDDKTTVVRTVNERTNETQTRQVYDCDRIMGVDPQALEFRKEGKRIMLGDVVMDESTAVRMVDMDVVFYVSDSQLKMSGADVDKMVVMPTKDGKMVIKPIEAQKDGAQKDGAQKGADEKATKTSTRTSVSQTVSKRSGEHRSHTRLASSGTSHVRVVPQYAPQQSVYEVDAENTTEVTIRFGDKKTQKTSSRPVVKRSDFGGR